MPEISVVIPAYNAEKYLAETVRSVLNQTLTDWELIIVVDGATDSTASIALSFVDGASRIRVIEQENRGLARARNRGYAESDSRSEFLIFVDADDILEPYALEMLRQAFEDNPNAFLVYGVARFIDHAGRGVRPPKDNPVLTRHSLSGIVPWDEPTTFEVLIYQNCIQTPGAVLLRRTTLDRIGLFDHDVNACADWDMWLRIALAGEIAFVPYVVLAYRLHGNNMSSNTELMQRHELTMRKKLFVSGGLSEEQRSLTIAVYTTLYLRQAACNQRLLSSIEILARATAWREPVRIADLNWVDREMYLVIAFQGDIRMVDKVISASREFERHISATPRQEIPSNIDLVAGGSESADPFNKEERERLSRAYRLTLTQEIKLRARLTYAFLRGKRPIPAIKHAYFAIKACCRINHKIR